MKRKGFFITIVFTTVYLLLAYNSWMPAETPKSNSDNQIKTTDAQPVRGGTLKAIRNTFPMVLGYAPEFGPSDAQFALPYAERLIDWDEKGNIIPQLAESWKEDPAGKTLTFYLQKGVKFHDGTPFNAEAVKWNMELSKAAGRLFDGELIKSIDTVQEYTVRLVLTEYTSMSVMNYGWSIMFSPTAFKKNGGKEWARKNAVGTGPFKLVDFKRDTYIRYERNDNYWRKGYPLLDAIEIRFIPDPTTSSMLIESKDADYLLEVSKVKNAIELEQKGYRINWGPGMLWTLIPNSSNPKSPLSNRKVREAIDCAIDRQALTKAIGLGKYEACSQIVPSSSPACVMGFNRPYNPEKAKKLLAEAGYPNGFNTKILTLDLAKDEATAIQVYLKAVGINAELDVADIGRYFGSLFSPMGWSDLVLTQSGINPDGTDLFVHWGPRPMTFRFGEIQKSPQYLALCEKALKTYNRAEVKKIMQQAVKQAAEDSMIIPLFRSAQACVMQTYVHSNYMKIHGVTWDVAQDWTEKSK